MNFKCYSNNISYNIIKSLLFFSVEMLNAGMHEYSCLISMVGLGRSLAGARETQRRAEQYSKTQRAFAVYYATVQRHVINRMR